MTSARQGGGPGSNDGLLWLLVLPVAAWGLHFLAVYVSAAVYCAKASAGGLGGAKLAIMAATVAALAALGAVAWRARAHRRDAGHAQPESRFVGSTVLMLCALSALAVLAVASVAFFFGDCRR